MHAITKNDLLDAINARQLRKADLLAQEIREHDILARLGDPDPFRPF